MTAIILAVVVAPLALIGLIVVVAALAWISTGYTRITIIAADGSAIEMLHVKGTLFEQRARRHNAAVREHGYTLLGPGVHVHDTRFGIFRSK